MAKNLTDAFDAVHAVELMSQWLNHTFACPLSCTFRLFHTQCYMQVNLAGKGEYDHSAYQGCQIQVNLMVTKLLWCITGIVSSIRILLTVPARQLMFEFFLGRAVKFSEAQDKQTRRGL